MRSLEEAGYSNYWKVLNAVDFGIPQNRERVFIVSIRKDLDDGSFVFPEGFDLKLRLKDMLEERVPAKFYLSDVMIEGFERHKDRMAEREATDSVGNRQTDRATQHAYRRTHLDRRRTL